MWSSRYISRNLTASRSIESYTKHNRIKDNSISKQMDAFVLTFKLLKDEHFSQWMPDHFNLDIVSNSDFHQFVPTSESFIVKKHVNSIYITIVASD